jgi:transcriptional regulator with XRE-family HTH domain
VSEAKRKPRPRRQATKVETKLADARLRGGLTQAEMAELTGISLPHYRRLERGQLRNPPLRFLVNCAIVLHVDLLDVVDDEWLQWMPFDARHPTPPKVPWRRSR